MFHSLLGGRQQARGEALPLRRLIYLQLNPREGFTPVTRILLALILLATVVAILETEPLVARGRERGFRAVEIYFAAVFSVEYAARLWSAPAGGRSRLRFVFSPMALIDLAAIVATLLPFFSANALVLRLLSLVRMVRVARLGRLSIALKLLESAVRSRASELLMTAVLALFALIFGATLLFWIESEVQPDGFGSIPRALWWAAMTMTTVGYGDIFPVTPVGKLVGGLLAITGIILVAIPTGILAAAFSEQMNAARAGLAGPPAPPRQAASEAAPSSGPSAS